jgi:outer membrane protein OmpA-like peptidoglycan-associated protein
VSPLRFLASTALLLCSLLATTQGSAQAQGFAVDRFDPAVAGSDWFTNESLDLRGDGRWAAAGTLEWAHKPLVVVDARGNEQSAILNDQVHLHVGGAVVLWDRVRFAASLPVLIAEGGQQASFGGGTLQAAGGADIGDLRLGGDVRIFGQSTDVATLAAGAAVYLPTGSRDTFTSDGRVRIVVPRVLFAGQAGGLAYAARTGLNVRTQGQNFAGEPFGSEWQFGLAAGVKLLDDRLLLGPEIYGSTVVSDGGKGVFDREATPVEALLGGHYRCECGLYGGLGAGPGLTAGLGAPALRVVATFGWMAPVQAPVPEPEAPADLDGDGIPDDDDACRGDPGPPNDDPKKNGCPRPKDADGDGILDRDDACVKEPGVPSDDPKKNGCPKSDGDGDGILDEDDACPELAGVPNDDPNLHGCPLFDGDNDGILDRDDACPDTPGKPNADPKKNGCPKAVLVGKEVKILERIEFDTAKATLRPESDDVLTAVLEVLQAHPELRKVQIQGHTDNRGARGYNVRLSSRRADSVLKWLVAHGIDRGRLVAKGFGPDKPIDDNKTEEGRQNNRRVEFHITDRDDAPTEE